MNFGQQFAPSIASATTYAYDLNSLGVPYSTVNSGPDVSNVTTALGGNTTLVGIQSIVSSGTTANGYSWTQSVPIKFSLGEMCRVRIAAAFLTGNVIANSLQQVGLGDAHNFLGFGYTGNTFGIITRAGGAPEVRTVAVAVANAAVGNAVLTLDGLAFNIPVVANDTPATIVTKIVAAKTDTFSTYNLGASSLVSSQTSGPRTGTFSLLGSGVTGTFSNVSSGVAPVSNFVPSALFNIDPINDTQNLGNVNPSLSQVYQVQFSNSGYGLVAFGMQSGYDGRLYPVHKLYLNNANVNPLLNTEALPMRVQSANTGNVTAASNILVTSMQADIYNPINVDQGAGARTTVGYSVGIFTIRKNLQNHFFSVFNNILNPVTGKPSFTDIQIQSISVSFDGPTTMLVSVTKNSALTDPTLNTTPQITYAPIAYTPATGTSVTSVYRGTGSNVNGGALLKYFGVPKGQNVQLDVTSQYLIASPGDLLTFSIAGIEAMNTVGSDISISCTYIERIS